MRDSKSSLKAFSNINLGTTITTNTLTEIKISVDPTKLMAEYGQALAKEMHRRNPIRFEAIEQTLDLQAEDLTTITKAMSYYMCGLAQLRVDSISGDCKDWRRAKSLVMTAVVQDALSCLGVVYNRAHGWKFVPMMKEDFSYDIETMLRISEILEAFAIDGLKLFKDAMPRGEAGDEDTMSCVIIDDEVRSMKVDAHPTFSYISAFLGLGCEDSDVHRFDVRYDLFDYIKFQLLVEVVKWSF